MYEKNFNNKVFNAAKWSMITEVAAKVVSPITNMILARIIAPEAFGVIATINMVISFTDMFTDAGFQKYLIQHEFLNDEHKNNSANVAFWTNLVISIVLWLIIIVFKDKIAILVGSIGKGTAIAVASFQLLLTSFSSIQMALYRREFDFKTLFLVRIISIFIPILITVPLALIGLSYWALIIGSIMVQLFNSIILTIKSKWKPKFFFSKDILVEMFSFSIWSLIEAISIWLTSWIDVFIVSNSLNQYYLGLYKTSTSMINGLMALITASIVPVFFSTMSRLQNDEYKFKEVYFSVQKIVACFVFPLGVGAFLYRKVITEILLGKNWFEASDIIGVWALISSICIVFGNLSSEVYRAKGKPKISLLSQCIYLFIFIPTCIISIKKGFWVFIYSRAFIRIIAVIIDLIIIKYIMNISIVKIIKNLIPIIFSITFMVVLSLGLGKFEYGMLSSLISIFICGLFYLVTLLIFPSTRKEIIKILYRLSNEINKKEKVR